MTIAERMPGTELGGLTAEEIANISDNQLRELVDTVSMAHERGIKLDFERESNFLYDRDEGYGVVDLASVAEVGRNRTRVVPMDLGDMVGEAAKVLSRQGSTITNEFLRHGRTAEGYADQVPFLRANVDVLTRYRAQVEQRLSQDQARNEALQLIDMEIRQVKLSLDRYSDPQWVQDSVSDHWL